MIEIFTGKTGQGKSLMLANKLLEILQRNIAWHKKTKRTRQIATNMQLSKFVMKKYKPYIREWADPLELVQLQDCDIFWDEIATHLDNTQWANLPLEVKRFLHQHRKRGIDIYGTCQSFGQVDLSFRRLTDLISICYKVFGSQNPSATKPEVKRVWGLIWLNKLDPATFENEKPDRVGSDWLWITRSLVDIYNTRQEIVMGKYPPLKHIVRECADPDCDFKRISHV